MQGTVVVDQVAEKHTSVIEGGSSEPTSSVLIFTSFTVCIINYTADRLSLALGCF